MSTSPPQTRVLLAGDVRGRFADLFTRVSAVHAKAGPFDVLLCVGAFFEPEDPDPPSTSSPPPPPPPSDDPTDLGELTAYITGAATPPVRTLFLGAFGKRARATLAALTAAPHCGIAHLGRAGVVDVAGLSVAFLDGVFEPGARSSTDDPSTRRHCTRADAAALETALAASAGDIDLFLTCQWPASLTAGLDATLRPPRGACPTSRGAPPIAALADAVRPPYHVSGGGGGFYARPPYVNPDRGAGAVVTRFVGLGPVGGDTKWLHALALVPAARLPPSALAEAPPDATQSPYSVAAAAAAAAADDAASAQPWRWTQPAAKRARAAPRGTPSHGRPGVVSDARKTVYVGNLSPDATEEEVEKLFSGAGRVVDIRRSTGPGGTGVARFAFVQFAETSAVPAAVALTGTKLGGREIVVQPSGGAGAGAPHPAPTPSTALPPPPPAPDCWFCLSNPAADVDLVVSVGRDVYVALDKGPIDPAGHTLVLPIEHAPSYLALPPAVADEIDAYLDALTKLAAATHPNGGLLVWERFAKLRGRGGGNHAQVNALAVDGEATVGAEAALLAAAADAGVTLVKVEGAARGGTAPRESLRDVVGDGEYYVATLPCGTRYASPVPRGERHPLTFGRVAAAAVARAPQRADWKECLVSPPEEVEAATAFKERFKEFEPSVAE